MKKTVKLSYTAKAVLSALRKRKNPMTIADLYDKVGHLQAFAASTPSAWLNTRLKVLIREKLAKKVGKGKYVAVRSK